MATTMVHVVVILLLGHLPALPETAAGESTEGQVRTGLLEISLTPIEVLGESGAEAISQQLPDDEPVEWQIYVPESYKVDNPAGVLVFINAIDSGGIPYQWKGVMDAHNLIWIGANDSGNDFPVAQRMIKAILAPQVLAQYYALEPERFYVAGFSGGGKVATRVASARPDLFKGGLYIAGSVSWENNVPAQLDLIKKNRHVFLAGADDFAMKSMKKVYKRYKEAGVENTRLMTIRDYKHRFPPARYLGKAITFLDSRTAQ